MTEENGENEKMSKQENERYMCMRPVQKMTEENGEKILRIIDTCSVQQ